MDEELKALATAEMASSVYIGKFLVHKRVELEARLVAELVGTPTDKLDIARLRSTAMTVQIIKQLITGDL